TDRNLQREEEFPEVRIDFQETFLGHTSPISRCRFSASGDNIASASVDGTVRWKVWIVLLIGTADGGIKAWNVDAKRVVCDLNTTESFPFVLDLKCSPVEPIFVSAAASKGYLLVTLMHDIDGLGFASLTVWNMRTWKAMTVLPLGKDPPAITSLCFNHNGKILAAAATDGMIHMFAQTNINTLTRQKICPLACKSLDGQLMILLSALFFLALTRQAFLAWVQMERQIFEWSLQSQGKVLWSRNCSRFSNPQKSVCCRHEMALDAEGRRLLVTSGSVRAPLYQVRGLMNGTRTLPHSAAVTTVDWHPTLPIFLTGSADNSVRVTSLL
ncbi:hypothetical protein RJ640_023149, partial [Escallonia rubra]